MCQNADNSFNLWVQIPPKKCVPQEIIFFRLRPIVSVGGTASYPPRLTALGPSFAVRFKICFLYKILWALAFLRMAFAIAFCSSVSWGSVLSTTMTFFFSSFSARFAMLASDFLCFALCVFLFTPINNGDDKIMSDVILIYNKRNQHLNFFLLWRNSC